MIRTVYDACVLYPASLRDFLLSLAAHELNMPFWSEEIQNEWVRNLLEDRPDLKPENLERTCRTMNARFPDSLVRGYESITPTLWLPDPKDRHVLAVAIHVKAELIITCNLRDFPTASLLPFGIEALPPDEFVWRLIERAMSL